MNTNQKILLKFKNWLTTSSINERYARATIKMYGHISLNFFSFLEARNIKKLNDVDEGLLKQFILLKPNKKPYAPASSNQRKAALDLLFTWAYEHRYCRENPLVSIKKSQIKPKTLAKRLGKNELQLPDILSQEEQKRLLQIVSAGQSFREIRDAAIIALILASALFAEEVITLQEIQLNLINGFVEIKEQDKRQRKASVIKSVFMPFIKKWLEVRKQLLKKQNFSLLFFTQRFKPMTNALLYHHISRYLEKANIYKSQKGADILRQTAIHNLLREGHPLEELQASIGHKHLLSLERYIRTL